MRLSKTLIVTSLLVMPTVSAAQERSLSAQDTVQTRGRIRLDLKSQGLLIQNVTVISPERVEPLRNAHVLISGDRIASVGVGEPAIRRGDYETIEGAGLFLIPGLIDGHVHFTEVPGLTGSMPELAQAYREQLPKSYLYFGFTTLIDLNVVDRSSFERLKQVPIRPDIYDCDGGLAVANGYPMHWWPPEKRFEAHRNFLYDERQADEILEKYRPEDHSPRAAVGRVKGAGGICVKTYFEPGWWAGADLPTPTKEMMAEVISESGRHDLTVTMHANHLRAHAFAAEVGVDVVAHGIFGWDGHNGEQGLPAPIREVLDRIVSQGIGFMATTRVIAGLRDMYEPGFLDDPNLLHVLPSPLVDWYRSDEGQWFANEIRGGRSNEAVRRTFNATISQANWVLAYLAEHGGNLLFGSDSPSGPTYGNPPGYNGYLELKSMAAAGVGLDQILRGATIANAEAFHLDSLYGTVEPGKVANLLLLRRNPLETVEAYDSIEVIILRGNPIQRQILSALSR